MSVVDNVIDKQAPDVSKPQKRQRRAGESTVEDTLAPVLEAEKGDIEFWVEIAQLVVLFMILREVSR